LDNAQPPPGAPQAPAGANANQPPRVGILVPKPKVPIAKPAPPAGADSGTNSTEALKATLKPGSIKPPESLPKVPEVPKLPESFRATLKPGAVNLPESGPPKTGDAAKAPEGPKPALKPGIKLSDSAPGKKIVIPKLPASKKPGLPNGKGAGAMDAEDLAASFLREEEKKPVEDDAAVAGKPIKHKCFFCEEEAEYPAELGGKQAPCVHCKRIIKIPLPVSDKPKDWREVEKRPTGAKRDVAELDDAWGTDVRATVGKETLQEVGVAPKVALPPERIARRIKRWVYRLTALTAVVATAYFGWKWLNTKTETTAIGAATKLLQADRKGAKLLSNEAAAEAYRGAGEYYLRATSGEGDLTRAQDYFKEAHGYLLTSRGVALERDIGLMELVLAEAELMGNAQEVAAHIRLKSQDARELMRRSLAQIGSAAVRAETATRLTRRLLKKGRTPAEREAISLEAKALVSQMRTDAPEEKPELLARVGLELFLAGDKEAAEKAADDILKTFYVNANNRPRAAPTLIALLVALGKAKDANEVAPPPAGNFPAEVRTGYALGLALQNDWEKARTDAGQVSGGIASDRMHAYIALIELARATKPDQVQGIVDEAVKLIRAPGVSPWMQIQVLRAGARASGKATEMYTLADNLKELNKLRNRANLEILRSDLQTRGRQPATEELKKEADKKEQAFPPTLALLARHNARYGGSRSEVESWQPESLRAVGLIAYALGHKDREGDLPKEEVAKGK
jgi:hypothetical protein